MESTVEEVSDTRYHCFLLNSVSRTGRHGVSSGPSAAKTSKHGRGEREPFGAS